MQIFWIILTPNKYLKQLTNHETRAIPQMHRVNDRSGRVNIAGNFSPLEECVVGEFLIKRWQTIRSSARPGQVLKKLS